jgi:hypothetical protein
LNPVQAARWAWQQKLIPEAKDQLARIKKNLESRVRGVFNRMTYWLPASGPIQVPFGRVARVAGRFNF